MAPANDHAERCPRPAVPWRTDYSGRACRFVERMLTVVTTRRLRGKGVLDCL